METANYWNFSKSKGHNYDRNGSIVPKTELDLDILKINLYTKSHFNMCNQCEENERKLLVDRPTYRPTAAKQYALPSSKGGIINHIDIHMENCSRIKCTRIKKNNVLSKSLIKIIETKILSSCIMSNYVHSILYTWLLCTLFKKSQCYRFLFIGS
jgi:hypothetical protein